MGHKISRTMYRVFILFCAICLCKAQIPSFGFCPDYLPMAHFDMNRFLGKWYEAERYFQFNEIASRCVVTDYAVGPNGKIYVSNEVTNRFTGVKRVIGGNMDLTGKKTEGKLMVKYDTTPISTTSALTILDTDYDTYAVIWSCSGLGPLNTQNAWLMTRERIPDSPTLQKAYGVLDRYKINRSFFVKTDQEGCTIAAADLNAALGIASTSTNVDQTIEGTDSRERGILNARPVAEVLLNKNGKAKEKVVAPLIAQDGDSNELKSLPAVVVEQASQRLEDGALAVSKENEKIAVKLGSGAELTVEKLGSSKDPKGSAADGDQPVEKSNSS
ncbi:apolipoprotein D-like [Euwallacea fornicatus]|uniref:apolipoprotein D-like n=1 Tax=Euwallacea fornicatus TaxID=995702 RepID=UPI00339069C9